MAAYVFLYVGLRTRMGVRVGVLMAAVLWVCFRECVRLCVVVRSLFVYVWLWPHACVHICVLGSERTTTCVHVRMVVCMRALRINSGSSNCPGENVLLKIF